MTLTAEIKTQREAHRNALKAANAAVAQATAANHASGHADPLLEALAAREKAAQAYLAWRKATWR